MTKTWLRRGATAVASARVAIGVVALAAPPLVARPWIGSHADRTQARVLARALGSRDLALGLGALTALHAPAAARRDGDEGPGGGRPAAAWVGAAALADVLDAVTTLAAWRKLPASRWLVALSAAGAAAVGAAASWSLIAADSAAPADDA